MSKSWGVEPAEAVEPLVLALDVGSTACRGALFDAHGRPVARRVKVPHEFASGADGTSQIDPDQVVTELITILDRLADPEGPAAGLEIGGVSLDTFASSLVVIDAAGQAVTPCMTYADSRPHAQVEQLRGEIDEAALHQHTGTRIHASYWPARLRWLRAEYPDLLSPGTRFLSLGDYVLAALTGTRVTGTASAAWTGMVDLRTADWSDDVLALAGIARADVAPIRHPDQPLEIGAKHAGEIARRWPALRNASWFAPIADGLAANIGLGAGDASTIGGSAATSGALRVLVRDLPEHLPGGLWCYRVSPERALVGGALNDVGRAIAWATSTVEDPAARSWLTEALRRDPDSATPLVLPFFTGERSTGWAANARAVITGLTPSSDPAAMVRGTVEGIAISYRRILTQLRELAPQAGALHIGGSVAAGYPEVLEVLADTLELPLTPVTIKRSTLLGNALLALETVAPGTERIGPVLPEPLQPQESRAAYYRERAERFESVYQALYGSD